jgi:hypothetical protein
MEETMHYISILSTVIVAFFAYSVLSRYRERGGAHLLLWGIGLIFYGLGVFGEAVMLFTFDQWIMKLWYLSGAMLTAAWLGQGTIHLLVRKGKIALVLTGLLIVLSLAALFMITTAPVSAAAAASYNVNLPVSAQYKDILTRNGSMTALTIFLNIYGTVALVGGAIYSSFLFWRKRVMANRMTGNILIAAGALLPALGGTFLRAGLPDWLYMSNFLGVIIMFAGFLLATSGQPVKERAKVQTI